MQLVSDHREQIPMYGPSGLKWEVAIERLKLYGMWDIEIDEAITILDQIMVICAEEERPKEEQPSED